MIKSTTGLRFGALLALLAGWIRRGRRPAVATSPPYETGPQAHVEPRTGLTFYQLSHRAASERGKPCASRRWQAL